MLYAEITTNIQKSLLEAQKNTAGRNSQECRSSVKVAVETKQMASSMI
jgi:hypothetical protein